MRVSFHRPKRSLIPPRRSHMLLDIRLQMPRSCLAIIPRVGDAVGAEDEFV